MSDSLRPHGLYPPGSSVHGIFQAIVLEWIAIIFSRGSSQPRSPALKTDTLPSEPPGKWYSKSCITKWTNLLHYLLSHLKICRDKKTQRNKTCMSFPFLGEHTMEKAFLCEDYIRNWEEFVSVWQENQANFGRTYGMMSLTWWHHQFDGHEFEQAPGVGDGQESLSGNQSQTAETKGRRSSLKYRKRIAFHKVKQW